MLFRSQRVLPAEALAELKSSLIRGDRSSSARNRLTGIVTSVEKDRIMAKVEIACGDYRIVSLMSTEAAEELGLEPGKPATAVVKATNVVVEVESAG